MFALKVTMDLSTQKVLTTKWVDGKGLDCPIKESITTFCYIDMNIYLTILLEIGMLHCDLVSYYCCSVIYIFVNHGNDSHRVNLTPFNPLLITTQQQHLGNILWTPDECLCILHWGMVTRLDNSFL